MLLAIDTSAGSSVAIVDTDDRVRAEASVHDSRRHAEVVGELLTAVLAEARVTPAELSGVVVGMGPGPFTGLRVGIVAARAFARATGVRLLPVASHDGIALADGSASGAGPLLVTTDARRRELYWSTYKGFDDHGIPVRTGGPGLARPDALAETAEVGAEVRRVDAEWVRAADLGLLASRMLRTGRAFPDVQPLYLRSPDVTVSDGPKRVST